MIKYICDFCKKEIDCKEIIMKCECKKIMPRIGSGMPDFYLHFHEKCATNLIGEDTISERNEKCKEAERKLEERRKEREAKMKGGDSDA